jgi:ABC-type protease/lipase transport system fused ATPase/permease subunit
VAAIVVWLVGESHLALEMRRRAADLARRGREPGARLVGHVSRHVRALRVVGVAGAATYLVFRDHVTGGEVIGVIVGVVAYLVVLEVVDVAAAAHPN